MYQDSSRTENTAAALQQQADSMKELLIRVAQKAVIGDLTSTVAHEINNPIFCILNFLELAQDELEKDHPIQDYLKEALDQTERISNLISELLCMYRAASGRQEPFDPLQTIQSAVDLYQKRFHKDGIRVAQYHSDQVPRIHGARGHLIGALIDLFDNARRSMESQKKGLVKIESALTDSGWLRIVVEDEGIGLPDQDVSTLFLPLVSLWDPPGPGLGLDRAKNHIESIKGTVTLEKCTAQTGTKALIDLPPFPDEENQTI